MNKWAPEMFMADDVLQALAFLVGELSELDQERRDAAAAAAAGLPAPASSGSKRAVIDPTPLRDALNSLPGQEFKIGEPRSCCFCCCCIHAAFPRWCCISWTFEPGRHSSHRVRLTSPPPFLFPAASAAWPPLLFLQAR